jgi:hypothetical protein
MQKLGDKLAQAGVVKPERKTTFPDGRMATSEAYLYYKARCRERTLPHITKMMFKWHLKHGQYLRSELVPNPFGRFPSRIYAIEKEAVRDFIDELERRAASTVRQNPDGSVVKKPTIQAKKEPVSTPTLMSSDEAFEYLKKKATKGDQLNRTMFGFYLAYELIDSTFEGRRRVVEQDSLEAFLDLFPTGLYKEHIEYVVKPKLEKGDLTMQEAYEHYKKIDPSPITINSWRALTAAGIVVAVRAENSPSSPTLGFTKKEVEFFARMRIRIAKKNKNAPATKAHKTKVERGTVRPRRKTKLSQIVEKVKEKPINAETQEKLKTLQQKPRKTGRDWKSIKEAYLYYSERLDEPKSESWFRQQCYKGEVFESKKIKDTRPNSFHDMRYLVDLDSIDTYLESNPSTCAKNLSFPLEKAYHKFRDLMPPGLTMIQFKRLVRNKLIKSFVREGTVRVRYGDVAVYFEGQESINKQRPMDLTSAYDYYCSKATDPVAKPHFARWIYNGSLEGGFKQDDSWVILMESIDTFLANWPTGRKRTNKNSRASKDENPTKAQQATVTVSMSKFATAEDLRAAIEALTNQGFTVEVEP